MSEDKLYPVPASFSASAHIDSAQYQSMYEQSVSDPESFWALQADEFVTWFTKWDRVLDWDFNKGHIRWFEGATLNVSYNCIDRHLETRANQTAIIWEGDDPNDDKHITYAELHAEVCKFSNALKTRGVKKATVSVSICPWFQKQPLPFLPVRVLVRCTRLCLAGFRQMLFVTEF